MISVVIPTYNNESLIASTISNLKEHAYAGLLKEIVVVDGGSSDRTVNEAEQAGAKVIHSIRRNRASLLNLGVEHTTGKILYFLFPGSMPPKHFTNEIVRATQKGYSAGSFTVKFDYKHWMLNILNWLGRVKKNYARLEDQSLFVLRELFVKAGAFREDYLIMEDQEIVTRLKRYSSFIRLKETILSSTKKYLVNGIVRTEFSYFVTWIMYGMGYSQERLMSVYNWMLGRKTSLQQPGDRVAQVSMQ